MHTNIYIYTCTNRHTIEMVGGGEVAFEAMKVDQLKVELAERGSTRSGNGTRRRSAGRCQRQPRQPVERRNLRRHESRARYSELVKVCDEVVRAAGVCGTKDIDPRKKCVDADHDCP